MESNKVPYYHPTSWQTNDYTTSTTFTSL